MLLASEADGADEIDQTAEKVFIKRRTVEVLGEDIVADMDIGSGFLPGVSYDDAVRVNLYGRCRGHPEGRSMREVRNELRLPLKKPIQCGSNEESDDRSSNASDDRPLYFHTCMLRPVRLTNRV